MKKKAVKTMADSKEKKKLVTILVPAYNEEEVLPLLYERLKTLMDSNPKYDLFSILSGIIANI